MTSPINVLLITEKYVDWQQPEFGLTNAIHNLVGSLQCSGFHVDCEHLFISPEERWSSEAVNYELTSREYDCALVSPVYITEPTTRFIIPHPDITNKKICLLWWDSVWFGFDTMMHHYPNCHNLIFDRWCGEEFPSFHGMEVPQDPLIFRKDHFVKEDIDISFIGRVDGVRGDRHHFMHRLNENGIPVFRGGGRGNDHSNLPVEEYASLFRRSKICLNFAGGHATSQRKGRIFEIAACGKFMMTNCPEATNGFFIDGEDYVSFDNNNIADKVRHYLANEQERKTIANNMYNKYMNNYTPRHFWSKVFNLCGVEHDKR